MHMTVKINDVVFTWNDIICGRNVHGSFGDKSVFNQERKMVWGKGHHRKS